MTEELLLAYLRENEPKLNMKGIAAAASIKQRTLAAYVSGERGKTGIPPETVAALVQAVESLRPSWPAQ